MGLIWCHTEPSLQGRYRLSILPYELLYLQLGRLQSERCGPTNRVQSFLEQYTLVLRLAFNHASAHAHGGVILPPRHEQRVQLNQVRHREELPEQRALDKVGAILRHLELQLVFRPNE